MGSRFQNFLFEFGKKRYWVFTKTKNKQSIPIFGLTATASFDVLSDVERELSGNGLTNIDTDAIVRFEKHEQNRITISNS